MFSCEFRVSFKSRTPRRLLLEMPCRICSCKLYRLPCYNGMQFKEHVEMDMAHIISSHLRFDLIEMYLSKKQRLKCIWVLIDQTIVANFFIANYLNPFGLFWREIFRQPNYKQKCACPEKFRGEITTRFAWWKSALTYNYKFCMASPEAVV